MKFSSNTAINQRAVEFVKAYAAINVDTLQLDDYNSIYLRKYKSDVEYNTLLGCRLIEKIEKDIPVIDFGGGIGFNSSLFQFLGYKKVTYVDADAASANAAETINKSLNMRNIRYVVGGLEDLDSTELKEACICSRDVIEHVYDLPAFFKLTCQAKTNRHNTAAIYGSWFRSNEFKKIHKNIECFAYEEGPIKMRDNEASYSEMREKFIHKTFPSASNEKVKDDVQKTRGLIYSDIIKAIDDNEFPQYHHQMLYTNTCDPSTGNWAERIIKIEDYERCATQAGCALKVECMPYNTSKGNALTKAIKIVLNQLVKMTGKIEIAPSFTLKY